MGRCKKDKIIKNRSRSKKKERGEEREMRISRKPKVQRDREEYLIDVFVFVRLFMRLQSRMAPLHSPLLRRDKVKGVCFSTFLLLVGGRQEYIGNGKCQYI